MMNYSMTKITFTIFTLTYLVRLFLFGLLCNPPLFQPIWMVSLDSNAWSPEPIYAYKNEKCLIFLK